MRITRAVIRCVTIALLAGGITSGVLIGQTRAEQEKQREQWQRVSDIFRAMNVRPGATVGDIGAGGGFFTTRLADAVGPSGRVFAVDVDDSALDRLRRRLSDEPHPNVTVVKGTITDPALPAGTLDAALIVNAYHEMSEHQPMLEALRRALKPDGRLVIVEPISERKRTVSRSDQTRDHEIAPEFALQDARAAGFRILGLEDPFTMRGRVVEWLLTLTPGGGTAATISSTTAPAEQEEEAKWRETSLRVSVDELLKLTASTGATIIDVRDQGMYGKGHIPNAVLVPLADLEASVARLRDLQQPFVTYCS